MAEHHTIETYGRAPHNRSIWSTATESQTTETYGRHAWPILLSVLQRPFIPLLSTDYDWHENSGESRLTGDSRVCVGRTISINLEPNFCRGEEIEPRPVDGQLSTITTICHLACHRDNINHKSIIVGLTYEWWLGSMKTLKMLPSGE